jgi:D-sedoheptulose 7-phosphate isomerase
VKNIIYNYQESLIRLFDKNFENKLLKLSNLILKTIKKNKKILLCGNGGSAANCNHIENDFLCVLPRYKKYKLNIRSLASNPANITCLANDFSYNKIFSKQISALGKSGDLLIVLSGSGNSKNIVEAIKFAKKIRMNTFSIVGYNGGECKKISNNFLHLKINDMQVCEDLQLIIFHICLRYLLKK